MAQIAVTVVQTLRLQRRLILQFQEPFAPIVRLSTGQAGP